MKQVFQIQELQQVDNGMGGFINQYQTLFTVYGYIDMLTGSDLNSVQSAIVEESTHILIIPDFIDGVTDDMRVVDKSNRHYTVTYSDNPVEQNHHNEIYLKYGGVVSD